jgi:DegT/DnrJ/EryC1/StrS aminotransferase family protein
MASSSHLSARKRQTDWLNDPGKDSQHGTRGADSNNKATPKTIPLLDLTRKYRSIESELHRQWAATLDSMRLLNGANLAAFEREFAQYCGVRHAIGVASGTDTIFLSLRARYRTGR